MPYGSLSGNFPEACRHLHIKLLTPVEFSSTKAVEETARTLASRRS